MSGLAGEEPAAAAGLGSAGLPQPARSPRASTGRKQRRGFIGSKEKSVVGFTVGIVPAMERPPAQGDDAADEDEAHRATGHGGGKERSHLELGAKDDG